ncbi:MAG: ComEC/Rec2 family competence protein, partial [Clostridia bacterium]|nr:ComEC/Rec2 family competence protein [Clostridia bacterium]
MQSTEEKSFAFNKRYLALGVLVYVIGTYAGLNFKNLNLIDPKMFITFSGGFAGFFSFIALILYFTLRKKREITALIFAVLISVLIFISAFLRPYFYIRSCDEKRTAIDNHRAVTGIIKSEPTLNDSEKSYLFDFDVYDASSETETISFDKSCIIRAYVATEAFSNTPEVGDSLKLNITFNLLNDAAFTGGFDFERYLRQDKIVYAGYSKEAQFIDSLTPRRGIVPSLERLGLTLRRYILNSAKYYSYADDEKQLLKGILVGETNDFSDELYSKYSASGLIHVASVSGMHTSYLFLAISIILGMLKSPKRLTCLVSIPIIILFASASLFTPSVCRAAIMMGVFLLSGIFRRRNDGITSLSIAGLILLIDNPYCLESCSALLSFSATLGILIYQPLIQNLFRRTILKVPPKNPNKSRIGNFLSRAPYKMSSYAITSISLSLSATIGLAYFMAYFFGRLQWGSIFANIIVFPLIAAAFIIGYI